MPWTVESVKDRLPDVPVRLDRDGPAYTGLVRGRKLDYAKIHAHIDGHWHEAQFAWETIVNILNTGTFAQL